MIHRFLLLAGKGKCKTGCSRHSSHGRHHCLGTPPSLFKLQHREHRRRNLGELDQPPTIQTLGSDKRDTQNATPTSLCDQISFPSIGWRRQFAWPGSIRRVFRTGWWLLVDERRWCSIDRVDRDRLVWARADRCCSTHRNSGREDLGCQAGHHNRPKSQRRNEHHCWSTSFVFWWTHDGISGERGKCCNNFSVQLFGTIC